MNQVTYGNKVWIDVWYIHILGIHMHICIIGVNAYLCVLGNFTDEEQAKVIEGSWIVDGGRKSHASGLESVVPHPRPLKAEMSFHQIPI